MTVTVTDSTGKPIAGAYVRILRGAATNRAGATVNTAADDMKVNIGNSIASLTYANAAFNDPNTTVTGADGTFSFNLSEDATTGLKTPITALLMSDTNIQTRWRRSLPFPAARIAPMPVIGDICRTLPRSTVKRCIVRSWLGSYPPA